MLNSSSCFVNNLTRQEELLDSVLYYNRMIIIKVVKNV